MANSYLTKKDTKKDILKKLEKNLPAIPPKEGVTQEEKDIQDDYEYSRATYRNLVDKSNEALNSLLDLAMDSEHPRAFEVLSNMMKNTSEMADKLIDLQGKMKKMKETNTETKTTTTTNNNVFVGSTEELQRFLSSKKQMKNVIEE
jgi:hypothetical protein